MSGFVWLWFLVWSGLNLYYTCMRYEMRCHLSESIRLLQNPTKIQVANIFCNASGNRAGLHSTVLATSWPCKPQMRSRRQFGDGSASRTYILVLDESRHASQIVISPEPVLSGQFPSNRQAVRARVNGMDGEARCMEESAHSSRDPT